ncbi:MAG: hypothetical protein QG574_4864 [Cyanobacteriota bacterium erpe_2018_sw_21hr_WHONDRS-SW48-000092_B_bin.40]|jgi:hypothetical protein|nr:hypothetical protein [Cyanobacteriota bacterium erpe_2018_sw_21hr_WHONDRS-SW48-000092_B_bin.40]
MLHRALFVLLFTLIPLQSASGEEVLTGQLASLRDLDANRVHPESIKSKMEIGAWILALQNSLRQSPKLDSLKDFVHSHTNLNTYELVFNVSKEGNVTELKWPKNVPSDALAAYIVDVVKSAEPIKNIPQNFQRGHRVALIVKMQPTVNLTVVPQSIPF